MIVRQPFWMLLLCLLLLIGLAACDSRETSLRPTPTVQALQTEPPQRPESPTQPPEPQEPQVQPPQPLDRQGAEPQVQPPEAPQVQPPDAPQLRPELPQVPAPQPQVRPGQAPQPVPEPIQPPPPAQIRLEGIWASQDWTDYGAVTTQMILQKDGDYSYQVVWGELMTYEVGIYEPGAGFIHFAVEDYQPKVYKGTELSRPTSWTVFYSVVDEDTMIWEDRILGNRWTVRRQR